MGILYDGPFGGFSGKTGGLVGRKLRGKYLVSALPHAWARQYSAGLQFNQQRFRLTMHCLAKIKVFIDLGFAYNQAQLPMALALKYNLPVLVRNTETGLVVAYPELLISRGRQAPLNSARAEFTAGEVLFTWVADREEFYNRDNDKVCFLVYNETRAEPVLVKFGALRADLGYPMAIPADYADDRLHAYCFTVAAGGRYASNGRYLGLING